MINARPGRVKKKTAPSKTIKIYTTMDLKKRLFNFPLKLLEIICKSFAPCKIPRVKTQKPEKKLTKPFDNKGTSTINTKVIKMAIW